MLTPLKLTHLILPLFLGVVYIYFILLLVNNLFTLESIFVFKYCFDFSFCHPLIFLCS